MSVPCKFERSLVSHDEYETIRLTHHPAIYDLKPADLADLRSRLRKMLDKERTLGRQKRRAVRRRDEPRPANFPAAERPSQRKRVFAGALRRVNNELRRLHDLAARTAHVEAAHKALALRRATHFASYPSAGSNANEGAPPRPSRRRRKIVMGARIGQVSQATKVAQAIRDARSA